MIARLWRIATRNVTRHKGQAAAAAAAVAVGTCVLAASLLAGQAAESGITQVAFDVLGETDEMVRSEGDFFFPQDAADTFTREVHERRPDVAVSPTILHGAIAGTPDGLTEPDTLLVGYPPDEEGFGRFHAAAGADTLTGGGVLVNERVADPLDLSVGDTVQLRYATPIDPIVPEVERFNGTLTGAGPPTLPDDELPDAPSVPDPVREPVTERYSFEVADNATRLVAILGWGSPENTTDLDLALIPPEGPDRANTNGTANDPDSPAVLNATAEPGTWTAEVRADGATAEQPFQLVVLELRPAFSLAELREGRRAIEQLGPIGDRLERLAGTSTTNATVAGVVTGDGKGGFTGEPAVFLPMDGLQGMLGRDGEVNVLRVSNAGGVREGLAQTSEVMPDLHAALDATQQAHPEPSVQALSVEPSKADIVDRAERAGADFTRFLTTLSSFTILAGILLVVNLFTMLGEERRVELSVMRALGMKKRHLVGAITFEGTLYSLPGAPIGAVAGLGLAYGLIEAVNNFVVADDGLPIPFVVDLSTVLLAAVLGLLFTVLAVAVTGWRLSRLHIASGLKDRDDPSTKRRTLPGWVLLGAGALLTALHVPTGSYTVLLLGPAAILAGGIWLVGRDWDERTTRFLASIAVIPYGLSTILLFDDIPPAETPFIASIRGFLLVIAAVVALLNTPGLPKLLSGIARRLGRFSPAAMVALSYPTRRQVRTGLTASMFALILLVLMFFSTFFTVFEVDPAREAGGYDVYAETRLPVEDLDGWAQANLAESPGSLSRIQASDEMPMARVVGGDVITINGSQVQYNGPPIDVFYGATEGFVERNGYELVSRQARLPSDQAAYRQLNQDTGNVVVSRVYDIDEAGRLGRIDGGERLTLDLGARSFNFTVLGAQSQQYLGGVFLNPDTVRDLFPSHGTAVLIQVQDGEDPTEVARQLEQDFTQLGLDAEDIRAEAENMQELNQRFFTVLQVFLGLGLVIGVASLGIVTAKSALEREHELGVLKAMGLPKEHITASLVGEALVTALLGILPGLVIGIAAAWAAWLAFFQASGAPFEIPWLSMIALSLISLAATLASTIPPARKAARADTATAVRIEM